VGVEVQLYSFFNLGTRWCGWVFKATPRPLYPWERPGGWVGLKAGLDRCGKSRPHRDSIPRTVQPVASRYTNYVPLNTSVFKYSIQMGRAGSTHGGHNTLKPAYNGTARDKQ
jgi:hypothetical protein